MTSLSLHNIVKTEIEANESNGTKWVTYTFTDKDGKKVEVVAFK